MNNFGEVSYRLINIQGVPRKLPNPVRKVNAQRTMPTCMRRHLIILFPSYYNFVSSHKIHFSSRSMLVQVSRRWWIGEWFHRRFFSRSATAAGDITAVICFWIRHRQSAHLWRPRRVQQASISIWVRIDVVLRNLQDQPSVRCDRFRGALPVPQGDARRRYI